MKKKVILADFVQKYLTLFQFNYETFTVLTFSKYVLIFFYMHIVSIGIWGHVIHYIRTLNGEPFYYLEIGPDVPGLMSTYLAVYIQILYLMYNKDIRALIEELGNFEIYDMPQHFEEETNTLNEYTKRLVIPFYMSQYIIWFLKLLEKCEDGDESNCGLAINAYMPFDIFYTPMRQIFAFLQCSSAYYSGTVTLSIVLNFLFMLQTLILKIKHLQTLLIEIPKMKTRTERKIRIKKCVLYHYRILYLTKECSKHAEKFMFVLVFITSFVIGLTSYQLVAMKIEITPIINLAAYLFAILLICVHGQRLIDESGNLFFTLYDAVPWGDIATTRDLYIMMMMSKSDLFFPAGKFGPIGHVRAMLVLKSSYSFLTLVLNM